MQTYGSARAMANGRRRLEQRRRWRVSLNVLGAEIGLCRKYEMPLEGLSAAVGQGGSIVFVERLIDDHLRISSRIGQHPRRGGDDGVDAMQIEPPAAPRPS